MANTKKKKKKKKKFAGEKPTPRRSPSSEGHFTEEPLTAEELFGEKLTGEVAENETFRYLIVESLGRLEQFLEQDLSACLDYSLPDTKALLDFYQSVFYITPSGKYLAQIITWTLARKITKLPANPFAHSAGATFFKEAARLRSKKLIIWTIWQLEEFLEGFSEEQKNLLEESE